MGPTWVVMAPGPGSTTPLTFSFCVLSPLTYILLTPEAMSGNPGTQTQNMLLDLLKLLHLDVGPQALVSPMDTVLWEPHAQVVNVEVHGEKVPLVKMAWQPPLWPRKHQRILDPLPRSLRITGLGGERT